MKKTAILIIGVFVVVTCFSLVSCQKKEMPKETESVTEPVGTVEEAPEAGGYGEEKSPEAGGYGEEKSPEAGGYGEEKSPEAP